MSPDHEHVQVRETHDSTDRPDAQSRRSRRRWSGGTLIALGTCLGLAIGLGASGLVFQGEGGGQRAPSDVHASAGPHATGVPAPGTGRTSAGIPVGYAHTRDGATSAAANYLVAYGSDDMFERESREQIIDTIVDPAAAGQIRRDFDSQFSALAREFGLTSEGKAPKGQTFVARALVAGSKVEAYDSRTARVAVWSSGIVGLTGEQSVQPVQETWQTTTITLRWTHEDWKWVDARQTDGPAPIVVQQPAGADELSRAVREMEGYRYAR